MPKAAVARPPPRPTVTAMARIKGRKGENRVHESHEGVVEQSADRAGHEADHASHQRARNDDRDADAKRDQRARVEPGENITPNVVRSHRVRQRRRLQHLPQADSKGIVRPEYGAENGQKNQDGEHAQ